MSRHAAIRDEHPLAIALGVAFGFAVVLTGGLTVAAIDADREQARIEQLVHDARTATLNAAVRAEHNTVHTNTRDARHGVAYAAHVARPTEGE